MVRILQFLFVLYIGVSIFRLKAFKTKFFPIIGEQIENFYRFLTQMSTYLTGTLRSCLNYARLGWLFSTVIVVKLIEGV